MKQKVLQFKISIGETFIQDVENGVVNIGMTSQRRITKSTQEISNGVQTNDINLRDVRVNKNG